MSGSHSPPQFSGPIGTRIVSFESVDSTNAVAASYASDPANHGLVATAASQTAGRGQYNRTWQAPPGSSILMSVLLFPPPRLRRPSILTAWAAVAVGDAILQAAGQATRIKWPNDILAGGKKICGILCEAGVSHIVAGIGVNVNQSAADFEKMALPDATSLAILSGRRWDVPELTRRLIERLSAEYKRLEQGETAALEADWKERFDLLGRPVVVERMDGAVFTGQLRAMSFGGIELWAGDGSLATIAPEAIRHLQGVP